MNPIETRTRNAPIDIEPEEFRTVGYQLIDRIVDYMHRLPQDGVSAKHSLADE